MSRTLLPLEYKVLNPKVGDTIALPSYGSDGAAGLDLRACLDTPVKIIAPGETMLIPTGIAIFINDPGVVGAIIPRSGLGHKHGIVLGNLIGAIDSDYQGEVFVSLWNRSPQPKNHSEDFDYIIRDGERIAQMLLVPIVHASLLRVAEFTSTDRGTGGFGSTGKN